MVVDSTKLVVRNNIIDVKVHTSLFFILVSQEGGKVSIFSLETYQLVLNIDFNLSINCISLDQSGQYILVCGSFHHEKNDNENNTILVYSIINGKTIDTNVKVNKISNLDWCINHKLIFMSNENGRITVFEINEENKKQVQNVISINKENLFWWNDFFFNGGSTNANRELKTSENLLRNSDSSYLDFYKTKCKPTAEDFPGLIMHENPYYKGISKNQSNSNFIQFKSNTTFNNNTHKKQNLQTNSYLKDIKKMSDLYPTNNIPRKFLKNEKNPYKIRELQQNKQISEDSEKYQPTNSLYYTDDYNIQNHLNSYNSTSNMKPYKNPTNQHLQQQEQQNTYTQNSKKMNFLRNQQTSSEFER